MTRRAAATPAVVAAAIAVGACGEDPPTRVRELTEAVVFGQVSVASGSVTDVIVQGGYHLTTCSGAVNTGGSGPVHPDATGRYRIMLTSSHKPFTGCVKVEARTPGGAAVTQSRDDVPFAASADSVRIDFSLP